MNFMEEYERIPIILKRYSFENKMSICQNYSRKCIKKFDYNPKRKNYVFPWELETFALMSIMRDREYDSKEFNIKGDSHFSRIMNSIRNYMHPELKKATDGTLINKFLMVTPIIQFRNQEKRIFKLFRYNFIFTFINEKINMAEIFRSKFECDYSGFLIFETFFFVLFESDKKNIYFNELDKISQAFYKQFNALKISRKRFIEIQEQMNGFDSNNANTYYYSFKYFFQYPFIEYDKAIHFPLPHLLKNSITDSLLYRITKDNNSLRTTIGKEVLEEYLYSILNESKLYDEVEREVPYNIGNNPHLSPDVMVYKDSICVLFDCKMSVPSVELLNFDEIKIEETIKRCAKSMIKVYERMLEFGVDYKPFKNKNDFKKDNIFGVVIWLEDNYMRREMIYKVMAEIMEIGFESDEMKHIKSHVKFVGMRDVEECTFYSSNYCDALIAQKDEPEKWYDFDVGRNALYGSKEVQYNDNIKLFLEELVEKSLEAFQKIFKNDFS